MFTKANYTVTMSGEKNGRGERHVKIMATVNGRSITFPTNIYVWKNQMEGEKIIDHPQAIGLNAMLGKYIIDLQNVEIEEIPDVLSLKDKSAGIYIGGSGCLNAPVVGSTYFYYVSLPAQNKDRIIIAVDVTTVSSIIERNYIGFVVGNNETPYVVWKKISVTTV